MGAGGMGDHEVPVAVDEVEDVALIVGAGRVGRQEVAGDGVVSSGEEGVPDATGVFTGYEYAHPQPSEAGRE